MKNEYNFTIDIQGKEIAARAFTLKEYLGLIAAKQAGKFREEITTVVKECTGLDINKDLPKAQAEYVVFMLMVTSIGEINHDDEYVCSCGNEIYTPINFNHIQIDKPVEHNEVINGLTLHFKPAKIFGDSDKIHTFLDRLDYLIVDGEQIFSDSLSDEEVGDLQTLITYDLVEKVCDIILKPTIHMGVPIKCDKCGSYHVEEFNSLNDFMGLVK